jgi:hypothetical protein
VADAAPGRSRRRAARPGAGGAPHARCYGDLVGLSGGLIGPDGTPRDDAGSLAGPSVFRGCSDAGRHISLARVHETAVVRALVQAVRRDGAAGSSLSAFNQPGLPSRRGVA